MINKRNKKNRLSSLINTAHWPSKDLAAEDFAGEVRARVRAAGPLSLAATAPSPTGVRGSGLVLVLVALLLLLLLELGRTGLVGGAASSGGSTQGA